MSPELQNILAADFFGNSVGRYLTAAAVFIGISIAVIVVDKILFGRLRAWAERTPNKTDDFIVSSCEKFLMPLLRLGAVFFALRLLSLPAFIDSFLSGTVVIALSVQAARLTLAVLIFAVDLNVAGSSEHQRGWAASKSMTGVLRILVWGFAIVFAMDNLGFNVSAVVAGLGIGGVAVALAAQTILGDLFNYFVVCFDKPFEMGDFIIVGDFMGEVEHIGIKSTRLRSLSGEQVIFSNTDLTGSRVRNYKRMDKRRALFKIGIIYETPKETVARISGMVKDIITSMPKVKFDRAHFSSFGDFALNFEIVYYVLGSDYNLYMDTQEKINLKIMEAFQREGIQFAYPTQTVYEHRLSMPPSSLKSV